MYWVCTTSKNRKSPYDKGDVPDAPDVLAIFKTFSKQHVSVNEVIYSLSNTMNTVPYKL
jgi:hypothetical protein